MTDNVTLLGVKGGPAIRPGSNMPTATLVRMNGRTILVDAGLGVSRALCERGVALTELDAIVITHLHSDHYLELGPLLHTAWTAGLSRCVPVYGPAGLADYWRQFLGAMAFDIALRIEDEGRPDLAGLVALTPLADGATHDLDGVSLRVMRNRHPPIHDSFALRFDAGLQSVVLSGDTAPMEEMSEFALGADLLVHEALLPEGVEALIARLPSRGGLLRQHILRSHTPAAEAGRIAAHAGVGCLVLTHFVPDSLPGITERQWHDAVRQTWDGPLEIGRDGMVIPF